MKLLRPESAWVGDEVIGDDEIVVSLTRTELVGLAGALNESREALDDWEFQTRMSITLDEARALQQQIRGILRETFRPE